MNAPHSLAPIVLFGYKRPAEIRQTLDALRANYLASQSDLHVFIDGPKKPADEPKVAAVRAIVDAAGGFRNVYRHYASENRGLATSVITGVSAVMAQYGKVIVLEDDLLTTPNFLDYMNGALTHYEHEPQLFSISGYTFPFTKPANYPFDAYVFPRTSSWGWATWADRWAKADWSVADYDEFVADKTRYRQFAYYGSDRPRMLRRWRTKEIDSWAIRWCYAQAKHQGVTLYPTVSKIRNIGFSLDSTNTSGYNRYETLLDPGTGQTFMFPDSLICANHYVRGMRQRFSLPTRLTSRVLSDLTRMRRHLSF